MSRFMISAAHKSSGKTVISTGLAAALNAAGDSVQTFKKGPDYIDPMWLSLASGRPCYNLDFNVMPASEIRAFYNSRAGELNLIEANKGLFDGVSTDGSDSNAELAKVLQTPVVLVIDTYGMTRGIAPLLMGYELFDKGVDLRGVILNKTGGSRHESKLRAAVEEYTDLKVLGAVGRTSDLDIGERHLGLITPGESSLVDEKISQFGRIVGESVDLDALRQIAGNTPKLEAGALRAKSLAGSKIRIGIPRDKAFGFYYPDDLEAFVENGAELVFFDAVRDRHLPDVDGLFIGGGFPETQAEDLAKNVTLRTEIREAIQSGMPAYAECGGLMYLCDRLIWGDHSHDMVGVIPGDAVMHARPQGRGYAEFSQTEGHPWGERGQKIKAHEFHYARVENLKSEVSFAREMSRGTGIDGKNDGILVHNLLAGFCHLRSSAQHSWVEDFVGFVREKARAR